MKKKILAIACFVLISGLSTLLFSSCDKDTTCYVEITVIDELTKQPVSGVKVKILDIDTSFGNTQGVTSASGVFSTQFKAPAILNVTAEYETGYDEMYTPDVFYCYRKGSNTIRLKPGEVVKSTINLEKDIIRDQR